MKASVTTKYGSPDVIQIKEVAKPAPKDNEVLIKNHATTVGQADCALRKGEPFIIKLVFGFRKPRFSIGGSVVAGEIEAIGKDVKTFKRGDQVFGFNPNSFGAHAEYLCMPEDKQLIIKSPNMTYEESTGLCDGGFTALTFLRDVARIQPGQKVLINGASGAVGTYAVQLAKYYGAEVTGVCSTPNLELLKTLGADKVIDYIQEDFTKNGQTYDVIFDTVGKNSYSHCKDSLTPKGIYLTTDLSPRVILQMVWTSLRGGKKVKFVTAGLMQNKDNLNFLQELVEARKLKVVIDRCYSLERIAEAYRYVETGHKKGTAVITVRSTLDIIEGK